MARRKSKDNLHRRPDSHAQPPSQRFFKVILDYTLQAKKMTIPSVFVNDFGNELKDEANLIVANGHVWKVGLTKSQNTVAFDKNWDGFAEHYLLQHGHFLLFKYKGSSNFKVRIFDKSCSEITYPGYEPNYKEEMGDDDVIETTSSKKRAKKGDCSNSPATLKRNQKTNKRLKRAASPEVANDKTSEAEGGEFEEKFDVGFGNAPPESKSAIKDARKFKSKSKLQSSAVQF